MHKIDQRWDRRVGQTRLKLAELQSSHSAKLTYARPLGVEDRKIIDAVVLGCGEQALEFFDWEVNSVALREVPRMRPRSGWSTMYYTRVNQGRHDAATSWSSPIRIPG